MPRLAPYLVLASASLSSSCSGGERSGSPAPEAGAPIEAGAPADCVPAATYAGCTPLYTPTYDEVFKRTFKATCAEGGADCHASTAKKGGINFDDADEAYASIVGATRSVRPSDASCSPLVYRLAATDARIRMPPDRSLDPGEQCAIVQWIAAGAKR
ncbi:MAG: hypothetical protein KF819_37305 [Labilithrix sp.]|nr:hypothetical protein [Labilithrix sp.]